MATTSSLSRSFPTLNYLVAPFRWFFRSRRRVLTVAVVLLAMIAVPPIWWCVQLIGLPDIGEPFDRSAFRSFTIPDDRNAFVVYRQAATLLKPMPFDGSDIWLEANREAMAIFRRGTERPDALSAAPPGSPESQQVQSALSSFFSAALLEASRLEGRGDMAGAWGWYRAALRSYYHQALRSPLRVRELYPYQNRLVRDRLSTWAADARTTPADLRRALDDVIACEEILPSDSYTIKAEYERLEHDMESPWSPGQAELDRQLDTFFKSGTIRPTLEQYRMLSDGWRWWRRESERSRRVLRLAIANWLAYYELPPMRRPKPDPGAPGPCVFYPPCPEAPAQARAITSAALGRWLASTLDAKGLLSSWDRGFRQLLRQERTQYRALVVLLASELYRRDHGADPPSEEALVGPYLKQLPDDGRGDGPDASSQPAGSPVQ